MSAKGNLRTFCRKKFKLFSRFSLEKSGLTNLAIGHFQNLLAPAHNTTYLQLLLRYTKTGYYRVKGTIQYMGLQRRQVNTSPGNLCQVASPLLPLTILPRYINAPAKRSQSPQKQRILRIQTGSNAFYMVTLSAFCTEVESFINTL